MPKYLIQANYTVDGVKALRAKGGSARRAAVQASAKSVGGSLETFYFCFGETDAVVILDLPDNAAAAALALAVGETGAVSASTTVLITPEEIDDAVARKVEYQAPE